jgi:hypothetical protein
MEIGLLYQMVVVLFGLEIDQTAYYLSLYLRVQPCGIPFRSRRVPDYLSCW